MKSGTTTKIVLFRSPSLSGQGHPSKTYMSDQAAAGSKKKGEVEKEFEAWWEKLIKREPHFAEYVKIKKACRDAFLAGRIGEVNLGKAA